MGYDRVRRGAFIGEDQTPTGRHLPPNKKSPAEAGEITEKTMMTWCGSILQTRGGNLGLAAPSVI